MQHICSTFAFCCCCLSRKFDSTTTTLLKLIATLVDFDCSVIYTWGIDKSKAVIGGVTVPQTWREHLPKNGSLILVG